MAPSVRTLDQILGELGTVYEPQVNSIRQRQSLIPDQIKQEEQGLQAKQENAFGDILGGARRRGLGFSGIPLGEQAKYTATEFLPSLARLRQSGREQAMSLEDAILGIQERRQNQALQLRQYEQSRLDAYESEQRQLAAQREQMAAQQRAAAAERPSPSLDEIIQGVLGSTQGGPPKRPGSPEDEQKAYDSVAEMLSNRDAKGLMGDYLATAASAKRGNIVDLYKLQMYRAKRPDLFKTKYNWESNYGF